MSGVEATATTHQKKRSRRSPDRPASAGATDGSIARQFPLDMRALPNVPKTEAELKTRAMFARILNEQADELRRRNLANAVKLAIEAAAGRGELVDHFAELGRRFGASTDTEPRQSRQRRLSVIEGGRL
ncbi:hypothetical protein [Acetobacter sp. DsW_063]|uniref:hypothetical protein n=1 Tax=Acetobacter sp. DsW_063 TaxID=1514894 RepID=UPI000A38DCA5|nr:hypothetical protein [Acetobacter sp. DsW_063]